MSWTRTAYRRRNAGNFSAISMGGTLVIEMCAASPAIRACAANALGSYLENFMRRRALPLLPGAAQRRRLRWCGCSWHRFFAFPIAHLPQFRCRYCPKSYPAGHLLNAAPLLKPRANVLRITIEHGLRFSHSWLVDRAVTQRRMMKAEPSSFVEAKPFPRNVCQHQCTGR
jgi:hypothetical protein